MEMESATHPSLDLFLSLKPNPYPPPPPPFFSPPSLLIVFNIPKTLTQFPAFNLLPSLPYVAQIRESVYFSG